MKKKQLDYIIKNYKFDIYNNDIKYLYEISEEILSDECHYAQIDNLKKASFFYNLYEDFMKEYSKNGEIEKYEIENYQIKDMDELL